MRRERDDGGYATVVSLGLMGLLVAATLVGLALAALQLTRHRAESAADLAALAAAHHVLEGPDAACAAAREAAAAQHARLEQCSLEATEVLVRVTVDLPGRLAPMGPVPARARAGLR